MRVEDICLPRRGQDIYPSRNGTAARITQRQEPIIYSSTKEPCPVDPSLVQHYEQQGFVILENVFSEAEINCFQAELRRLRTAEVARSFDGVIKELKSGDVRSLFEIHKRSLVYKKLAADKRLAGLAKYILGDDVYVYQSRLNYKPGFRGGEFYWHSDFETWHVEDGMPRMRALSMSVALTENFEHNGPLMLVPGSHRYFVVCKGTTPSEHYKSSLKRQTYGVPDDVSCRRLIERSGIVSATGKPGSVTVFDCNTLHGSFSNITPYPRSNLFFVYNACSNRVTQPFCGLAPRPEYLCTREQIEPLKIQGFDLAQVS